MFLKIQIQMSLFHHLPKKSCSTGNSILGRGTWKRSLKPRVVCHSKRRSGTCATRLTPHSSFGMTIALAIRDRFAWYHPYSDWEALKEKGPRPSFFWYDTNFFKKKKKKSKKFPKKNKKKKIRKKSVSYQKKDGWVTRPSGMTMTQDIRDLFA